MKGFWKRAAMGLLAIAMLLCAACAAPEQEPEQEMQTDIAGADWRTYGQVSDAGTITRAGEQTSVLACVFDSGVEFYLDEETQTFFAEAVFPEKIEGAHDLFEALSLDDLNGDGDSDVQLMVKHGEKNTLENCSRSSSKLRKKTLPTYTLILTANLIFGWMVLGLRLKRVEQIVQKVVEV